VILGAGRRVRPLVPLSDEAMEVDATAPFDPSESARGADSEAAPA
jgi:hypothetical protein